MRTDRLLIFFIGFPFSLLQPPLHPVVLPLANATPFPGDFLIGPTGMRWCARELVSLAGGYRDSKR